MLPVAFSLRLIIHVSTVYNWFVSSAGSKGRQGAVTLYFETAPFSPHLRFTHRDKIDLIRPTVL